MFKRLASGSVLAALLVATAAMPQQTPSPVYNVEVIVFRAAAGPAASEDWSTQSNQKLSAQRGDSGDGATGKEIGRYVQPTPLAQFKLQDVAAKLQGSGQYQLLSHLAWSQTASSWGTRAGFTLERLGTKAQGLSGLVALERGQFLHLGLSLNYAAGGPRYNLTEMRRIKLYEKVYFDHPAFGVIALVTPTQGARAAGR